MAQMRCMIDLLFLITPDQYGDQGQEQEELHNTADVSVNTLEEDAKLLAGKLNFFSRYIIRYWSLLSVHSVGVV